jgi:hypothetical protein
LTLQEFNTENRFYEIPIRHKGQTVINDDKLRAVAHSLLAKVAEELQLSGLDTNFKEAWINDKQYIKATISYGEPSVELVDLYDILEGHTDQDCFCSCGVTFGIVIESPGDVLEEAETYIPASNAEYKLAVCQKSVSSAEIVEYKNRKYKPLDFYQHKYSMGTIYEVDGKIQVYSEQERHIYALIADKDIEVELENGQIEKRHITLDQISPCEWDQFRVMSLQFQHDSNKVNTEEGSGSSTGLSLCPIDGR